MSLRGALLKNLVFPVADWWQQFGAQSKFQTLLNAQNWDRSTLIAHRDAKARELVQTVYSEVPFYQKIFADRSLTPKDFQSLSDLTKLPILTKDAIRENFVSGRMQRPSKFKTYDVCSSGSTGTNLVVREDTDTTGMLYACHLYGLKLSGWNFGDRHVQFGFSMKRTFFKALKDRALSCEYAFSGILRNEALDRLLDKIESQKIKHVHGFPGSIFSLAERARQTHRSIKLDAVVTWGDNLFEHYRRSIESAFQTRVFDTYGCAEGITVSAQCGHGTNYHLYAPFVHVEVVDDEGKPVPKGTLGHLILTRLIPGTTPLIRYRVGDLGVLSPQEKCACGSSYDIMDSIQGRDTDLIVTPSGNRLIVHFFTGTLNKFPAIKHFQVVQKEKDRILIRWVSEESLTHSYLDEIRSALSQRGADISVDFERVEEIPTTKEGKRRFVISEVQ